jgi:hypothetical protein
LRLIQSLDPEDSLTGAGVACLTLAGALVHPALGIAVLGIALIVTGIALARRSV